MLSHEDRCREISTTSDAITSRKGDARSQYGRNTCAREARVWHPVIMRSGESISGVNPTGARARTAVDVIAVVHGT